MQYLKRWSIFRLEIPAGGLLMSAAQKALDRNG